MENQKRVYRTHVVRIEFSEKELDEIWFAMLHRPVTETSSQVIVKISRARHIFDGKASKAAKKGK